MDGWEAGTEEEERLRAHRATRPGNVKAEWQERARRQAGGQL